MPYSSMSRASTRRAVCCCLRQAVRSSTSIASISDFAASSFGATRTGTFRGAGTGRQRRPHRSPVHPVPLRQRPDRELLAAGIAADRFIELHPRPQPGPSRQSR